MGAAIAEFEENKALDGDKVPLYKEELSNGREHQGFESHDLGLETSQTTDYPECMIEKAELASHRSVVCSCPEMWDSSFVTEMPTLATSKRQDSPELLNPIDGESGRRSLLHRRREMPAIDPRSFAAKQLHNGLPNTHESGNTNSSAAREASQTDDLRRVPIPVTTPTSITDSAVQRPSDVNRCAIFVSNDISSESSDNSVGSREVLGVETTILSSPRHRSLDLSTPLPTPPQIMPPDLNRPLWSIQMPNSAQTSSTKTSSSLRSSVMNQLHRLSGESSVSNSGFEVVERTPTDQSPDLMTEARDNDWEDFSQHEPSITISPTDIENLMNEMLAGNALSGDPSHRAGPRNPYSPWDNVSPSTLAPTASTPASNLVSPNSPNCGYVSPLLDVSTPISPIVDFVSSPPEVVLPVTVIREGPDQGNEERNDDAASGFPSTLDLATRKFEHKRSASNIELGLANQLRVLHRAVSFAPGAQWTKDTMLQQHFHPSHRRQFDDLDTASVCNQPRPPRMESYDLAGSIDELVESEAPSALFESIMIQFDPSESSNPVFVPSASSFTSPERNIDANSSFMDGSMKTAIADTAAPILSHFDRNADDHNLYKMPSHVGRVYPPPLFSTPYSSETGYSALCHRRQMNVPPLPLSRTRTDIASSVEERKEATAGHLRSSTAPRSLNQRQVLPQSQSSEGKMRRGEFASSGNDLASTHRRRPDLDSTFSTETPPHCFDHGSMLVTHSASKQTQVNEFRELVGVVNDEWLQRLKSVPGLWQRCSILSPRTLFEKGFQTLREIFCGRPTQTFENVFAFMNLAFAAALVLHFQQKFYCLDAFYDDARQWQRTLSAEEKILFLKAVDCLLPELQPAQMLRGGSHVTVGGITSQDSSSYRDQTDLLDAMINSEPTKCLITVIDAFEEAVICERNAPFPPQALSLFVQSRSDEIEHMRKHVTGPLLQTNGVEALRRIVIDTERLIASGKLRSPREVEVTLITSGRSSSESLEVFDRYRKLVLDGCNKAMLSSGSDWRSTWRNEHYIVALDQLMEVYYENIEMMSPEQPNLVSPAPWSSISNGPWTLDSSPTSAMSWTTMSEVSTRPTSLTILSPASTISPTSPTPNTPTTSVASCPACSRKFRGSPQDARSNLQRHLRTSRRHNKKAGLKCPHPKCLTKDPMRSDNLGPHLRKNHKEMSAAEREAVLDKCKLEARGANNAGTARRRSYRD